MAFREPLAEDKRLKKAGVAKKNRPVKPRRNVLYPTMQMIALNLLLILGSTNSLSLNIMLKKLKLIKIMNQDGLTSFETISTL
jgi:hypothetical protein